MRTTIEQLVLAAIIILAVALPLYALALPLV